MYYPVTKIVNALRRLSRMRPLESVVCILFLIGLTPANRAKPNSTISNLTPKPGQPVSSKQLNCLPKDVHDEDVVSYSVKGKPQSTVSSKLSELKARCRKAKLVDAKGREIRFFRTSCWGNPPADYQEIRARERLELNKLKRRYTVIVFSCNPMIQ